MPARRSIRLKRKTIDNAEKRIAAMQRETFKRESSPAPELDSGENGDQFPGLGQDSDHDDTQTPPATPETPIVAPTPPATPETPIVVDADAETPDGTVFDPIVLDFNAVNSVVDHMFSAYVPPSTYSPLLANANSEVFVTENQRIALRAMGAPEHEINAASTVQAVDDLFYNYGNKPSQRQIDYLRSHGVSDAEIYAIPNRDTATVLIARMKAANPATTSQVRYLRKLYARDRITTPLPPDLREGEASRLITSIQAERPTTQRQRALLRYYGVLDDNVPKLFAAAKVAIDDCKLKQGNIGPRLA